MSAPNRPKIRKAAKTVAQKKPKLAQAIKNNTPSAVKGRIARGPSKWSQMVMAPGDNAPTMTPSLSPFRGAVRTFTRTETISAANAGDAYSIQVRPEVNDTLRVTTPNTGAGDGWELEVPLGAKIEALGGFETYDNAEWRNVGIDAEVALEASVGTLGQKTLEKNGYWYQPFIFSDATVDALSFELPAGSAYGKLNASGTFVMLDSNPTAIPASFNAGLVDCIGLVFFRLASFNGSAATGFKVYNNISAVYPIFEPLFNSFSTQAINLSKVSKWRITAMSVLASYSGNMFNNGGVIAAARTQSGFTPSSNVYQSLTDLQENSFSGPLKDGAYVWWLPYDLAELEFRDDFDPRDDTNLWLAGKFADSDGTIKLTLHIVMEFYSPLQIFEHDPWPALMPAFTAEYHALDTQAAACSNHSHEDVIKLATKIAADKAQQTLSKALTGLL